MPQLIINGIEVEAQEGATILEAAHQYGIWIPTLCYYPKTTPSDSCRMCIVEIEGIDRPVTSCNTIVSDGMNVSTDTPRLKHMREEVMKLILMDHPLDCPVCPAGGECEIQDLTHRLGIYGTDFPLGPRNVPPVRNWPLIEYDQNLCIQCQRCVKVCHEVIGASALILKGKGYNARIDTKNGNTLDCDFCGECVEACPSGAMSNKLFQRWARAWEFKKVPTICTLCPAGCRLELNVKDNRVFRVTTELDTHNKGTLCVGGRFGYDFIHNEARLKTPLMRKNGELQPVSWDQAISFVAEGFKRIISESGPESIAGLGSARLSNEDCFTLQKLFRTVIGTHNVDSEARFSYLRVQRAFELTGVLSDISSLDELVQTGAIFVIGTDPLEESPSLGWKIKTASRRHDSNLILANSRKTSLDQFARVRLRIRPYSESDLALGLMKIILELDLWDRDFISTKVSHFLPMKNLLDKISLNGILKRTGVARDDLVEAANLFGGASEAVIIFGGDVILQEDGLQCAMNLTNLALLTGNTNKPGAGIYPIFEKGNFIGLSDMGLLPEYLPGYQALGEARDLFERVWNTHLPYSKGLTVSEMVRGMESGKIRALYTAAADPLTDYPYSGRFASALRKLELLVVQDLFLSPTAQLAHVVFPAASFAEKEGTTTNIERRVQKLRQAVPPPGEARPDWAIFEDVARAMGVSMGFFSTEDIFREITQTIPFYRGIKLKDLDGDGTIVGPSIGTSTPPAGKPYSFAPVRTIEKPISVDQAAYPFELMAGRSMYHFGSTSTRSIHLSELCSKGIILIHPDDALKLGVNDDDTIQVSSPVGAIIGLAKTSDVVSRGMVFVPTNFPDLPVYRLFQENTTVCRVNLSRPG